MEALLSTLRACGAVAAGAVPLAALEPHMTSLGLRRARHELPQAGSLLVGLFPYFVDLSPGNIALYARGLDYHAVLGQRLRWAARQLEADNPSLGCAVYVDASPYPEVRAAALAGLGVVGQNGLLIAPRYGSLVFIGTIATTRHFTAQGRLLYCQGCGRCIRACPVGALGTEAEPRGGPDGARCLSSLSQLRGSLTAAQSAQIARNGMAWGCDRCQKVCPMNRDLPVTPLPQFKGELLRDFPAQDVGLSRRAFKEKYADRAFAWRGIGPLRRNMALISARQEEER